MSKNKQNGSKNSAASGAKSSKKIYTKPKIKTVKIESTEVFATDTCGGSGY